MPRRWTAVLRRLVELDRRFDLDGGIFFLDPGALRSLVFEDEGNDRAIALSAIEQARKRREIALSLPVPSVLFSDDLEAIGGQHAVLKAPKNKDDLLAMSDVAIPDTEFHRMLRRQEALVE